MIQPFIYVKIAFAFFITSNEITICYPINVHLITFYYIYILHVFKHNALGLHLTLSKLKYQHLNLFIIEQIKNTLSIFNKKNTIKNKEK